MEEHNCVRTHSYRTSRDFYLQSSRSCACIFLRTIDKTCTNSCPFHLPVNPNKKMSTVRTEQQPILLGCLISIRGAVTIGATPGRKEYVRPSTKPSRIRGNTRDAFESSLRCEGWKRMNTFRHRRGRVAVPSARVHPTNECPVPAKSSERGWDELSPHFRTIGCRTRRIWIRVLLG